MEMHIADTWGIPALLWKRYGWTGVDLFFVLSGFLVGGLLCKELHRHGTLNVRRFLIRRGLKIWPAYYAYLAGLFALIVYDAGGGPGAAFVRIQYCVLNIQNDFTLPRVHLWSLAVEEHFYLVLALALGWVARRVGRSPSGYAMIPWAVAIVVILCTSLRTLDRIRDADSMLAVYATHLRLDSLAFGFLLAYVFHFRRARGTGWSLINVY